MNIGDIEAFAAVARRQSLSHAATELGITQPAITRRVQNLEQALGQVLLNRNTKPPRPTDAGQRVAEQCRAILREVDALRDLAAQDQPPAGVCRIGIAHGLADLLIPSLPVRLAEQWPTLAPQITTGWGGALAERVAHRELDTALLFLATGMAIPDGAQGQQLLDTRLAVVGRRGDWPRRRYRLADCCAGEHGRGWVLNPDGCGFRAALKRALDTQGLPLQITLDTYGRDLQLQSVADGLGLGLAPLPILERSPLRGALSVVPVSDFKPAIDLWLLRPRGATRLAEPLAAIAANARAAFGIKTQRGRASAGRSPSPHARAAGA